MEEIMTPTRAGTATLRPGVRRRVWNIFLWVLQVGTAAMFLSAGWGKLTASPDMVAAFEAIGFGEWVRLLPGALEVIGAGWLVVPRVAGAGALLLAAVMVGAVLTHLFLVGGSALPALVLLVALVPVALARPGGAHAILSRF